MSTYRYARDSKTSAQRAAAKWQQQVNDLNAELAVYAGIVSDGRQLSDYDAMRQRNASKRLAKLMAENPNEPV